MTDAPNLIDLTADIVVAYLTNTKIEPDEVPELITATHAALGRLGQAAPEPVEEVHTVTKTQIRRSISEEALTSFIDGKSYKTLKRHLSVNGLTPDEYRERYGLPYDYPMVAPGYAARRSALAKAMGLGRSVARKPVKGGRKSARAATES